MTLLKREKDWLREVDNTALQSATQDLDRAYTNFFRGLKNGKPVGYPRYKSKRDNRRSYRSKTNVRLVEKHIRLPKLGMVKCKVSKKVEGRILNATVSQNPSGKYFVSVLCTEVEIQPLDKTGAVVGVDLGLKELLITSDGKHFQNPKYFVTSQKKLAKLHRQLSRKPKDSKNREKARIKAARLQEHIADQRLDNIKKITTSLIKDYDLIIMETLSSKNMTKNRRLAKAISDAAWGETIKQLDLKCLHYGRELIKVDRFYPSSQTCNNCGFKNVNTKNLAVREWSCPQCGIYHDRDINAAKNILDEGLRIKNAA